jgi:hypothetical protein
MRHHFFCVLQLKGMAPHFAYLHQVGNPRQEFRVLANEQQDRAAVVIRVTGSDRSETLENRIQRIREYRKCKAVCRTVQ